MAVALAVLLIGTLWGGYYCFLQEHRALYRNVVSRRGFPVGIGDPFRPCRRTQAAAALRPGLQGARLGRLAALLETGFPFHGDWTGADRLTANHGIGTFFWRAHDEWQPAELNKERGTTLGLSAVCQWEYVSDARGDIAYERGMDRDGRMVYACVYSPTASGSSSARIAHYVGPDGFPQLQNKSAAEYVEIHYNAEGWEERILYLDALARPATGPDGAFGIAKEHDGLGKLTSMMSLDEHGQPMIDRAGNAGLRTTYDKDGLPDEIISVGTDGKIAAVTDGWARIRDTYDALGRLSLVRSFDVNDRPVVRRSNLSGVEEHYDDDGDLVLENFLGPDGKPMAVSGAAVSVRYEYDAEGNEVRTTFLDPSGHVTRGRDGSCGYASGFDARQNLVSRTVFGADGKPFLLAEGYAGWRSEFDDQGRETRRTFYGVSDEPVLTKDGCHGWETRYDPRATRFGTRISVSMASRVFPPSRSLDGTRNSIRAVGKSAAVISAPPANRSCTQTATTATSPATTNTGTRRKRPTWTSATNRSRSPTATPRRSSSTTPRVTRRSGPTSMPSANRRSTRKVITDAFKIRRARQLRGGHDDQPGRQSGQSACERLRHRAPGV